MWSSFSLHARMKKLIFACYCMQNMQNFVVIFFSYHSNDQQSNENKTYSKISHVIERINQVTSLYLTC